MVRNDLFITVPSFFKCPISLDVMKSPVSLCTGVTYDRSSIQAWLDNGNNTCPATMQVLPSKDFVPNHNLHRLIQIWSNSVDNSSQSDVSPSSRISRQRVSDLVKKFQNRADDSSFEELVKIAVFAKVSDENRKFIAEIEGFVPALVGVFGGGGNVSAEKMLVFEQAIRVLDLILAEYRDKDQLIRSMSRNRNLQASILLILQKGSLESRVSSARILESIAIDAESKLQIAETEGVLNELSRLLVTSKTDSKSDLTPILAGLSCLITISVPRRVKVKLVRLGLVETLGKCLSELEPEPSWRSMIEKILKVLEMVSSCTEGRAAICSDPICVRAIVEKMLKVSKVATEHAVVIMWSVCYLFRDQVAQEAVMKSNGLTKILLIMQSNCSPSVRQMCGDLMKIFRVNSKSCLSSYDTKTTHIMPF